MKPEWTEYLKSIGIDGLFLGRAERAIGFYEALFPNEITHIFVSEYVDKDGVRQYENLWVFTPNYAMEAKSFLTSDDYDSAAIKKSVTYWKLKREEFERGTASNRSRMNVVAHLQAEVELSLKASAENCDYLHEIFQNLILPNVVVPA